MLLLFLAACTPLVGDWSGTLECENYSADGEFSLEWQDDRYEGEGSLDCSEAIGLDCEQIFDLQVEADGFLGEQDLRIDLDNCEYTTTWGGPEVDCINPDDVEWDGADTISGDWDTCEFSFDRDD